MKQAEISIRLDALEKENVGDSGEDDCEAFEKFTKIINQFAPMPRPKDRDDEAKIGFLTKAVAGVEWG